MEAGSEIPREKLRQIVEKNGEDILQDFDRVEGLLRDHCGSYRKEISALIGALNERVPLELKSSWQTAMTPEAMRSRLVQRLEENRGLAPQVADWAVEAWSHALGIGLGRKSDKLDSVVLGTRSADQPGGYVSPGFVSPGHVSPGYGAPGSGAPGFGGPGYVSPGYVSPGAGQQAAQGFNSPQGGEYGAAHGDRPSGYRQELAGTAATTETVSTKKKAGLGVGVAILGLAAAYGVIHHPRPQPPVPKPVVNNPSDGQQGSGSNPPAKTPPQQPQQAPSQPTQTATAPEKQTQSQQGTAEPVHTAPVVRQPVTPMLSAGTLLDVRLNQGINSDDVEAGQEFTATVATAVMSGGKVVIPRGSDATLRIVGLDRAGKLTGKAVMRLQVVKLTAGDRHLQLSTSLAEIDGPAQAVQAAKRTGIGGAIGAGVGFLGGKVFGHGGKGALAGGTAGGVVGAATTKPQPAIAHAEMLLHFRLTRPVAGA